jgi:hypothetical protein
MTATRIDTTDRLLDLRARMGENASINGETEWENSRLAWNRVSDQRPVIVVKPGVTDDVVAALEYARAAGLRVAVQGTGHGAGAALGNLDGAMLLQMSRMRDVIVDPATRSCRVGAGATWDDVAIAAARHGLAGLAGSSPNVGVAGFAFGGGVGWLSRAYGLSANAVRAVEAVLADGRVVRANAEQETELYWALRGGGGSFAVVTGLEIELVPVALAYAGFMMWPVERASEVLHAWLDWTRGTPDGVTTSARIMQFPAIPHVPEPMRGRSFAIVDGAILGPEAEAIELARPLNDLGPITNTFASIPAPGLNRIHLDPEDPVPAITDGFILRGFDHEALDAVLAVSSPKAESALLAVEVRQFGGALSVSSPSNGVVGNIAGDNAVLGVGMAKSPEMEVAVNANLDELSAAVQPWKADPQFPNFGGRPRAAEEFYRPADLARLRAVRAAYDPGEMLLSNRPL